MELITEPNIQNKKNIKKQFSRVGRYMLDREILMLVGSVVIIFIFLIYKYISNKGLSGSDIDKYFKDIVTNPLGSIGTVLCGFLPINYFIKKNIGKQCIINENKKFSIKTVMIFFVLLLGINCSCGLISKLMEFILNDFGFTMKESETMLEGLNFPYMFIYVAIIGPIIEELTYRGMVLRFLDKFDKGVAIVGSGVLFGLMHGNFYQIFMAIGIGIFLGYIAEEYSIKLTILLHIINNTVSFGIDNLIEYLGNSNIVRLAINGGIIVITILTLIILSVKNKEKIAEAFNKYKAEKSMCLYFFSRVSIILVIIVNLVEACSQISKL